MAKFSAYVETFTYRFIAGIFIGFCVGALIFVDKPVSQINNIKRIISCSQNLPPHKIFVKEKKKTLFIGMMSMQKYLNTRVDAALNTWWNKNKFSDMEVFSYNDGEYFYPQGGGGGVKLMHLKQGVRVIQLPGISDNVYPPQKKSFAMIKYMHDHKINNYDWFLRLDDDAYVKRDKLLSFLSHLDPSRSLYIGSPGYGKHDEDYVNEMGNYCMGGPGVIISRGLLKRLGSVLGPCLREMRTNHEDVELGRCIAKMVNVTCISSWEGNDMFYQNFLNSGNYGQNINGLSRKVREKAVTFHANKNSTAQYKLHKTLLVDTLNYKLKKLYKLQNEVAEMDQILMSGTKKENEIDYKCEDKIWTHVGQRVHSPNGWNQPHSSTLQDIVNMITETNYHGRHPDTISHMRVTRSNGLEVSITKTKAVSRKTTLNRQYYFKKELMKNFVFFNESRPITSHVFKPRVHFVVAISNRPSTLMRFLSAYENVVLLRNEKASLVLSYFIHTDFNQKANPEKYHEAYLEQIAFIMNTMKIMRQKFPRGNFLVLPIDGDFSRANGLQIGAEDPSIKENDIIFFCDVDMYIDEHLLTKIRKNTIPGKQAYYPRFFSQYKSSSNPVRPPFLFGEDDGFWRSYSYGMLSIYKSDFLMLEGFDLTIQGWGLEDVDLLKKIQQLGLDIFRSNDDSLVHIYHDKFCSRKLPTPQLKSCKNSRADHFGNFRAMSTKWWMYKRLQQRL